MTTPNEVFTPSRHSLLEDVVGFAMGTFATSLGLYLIQLSGAVTGGLTGVALLASHATGASFSVWYWALSVPFAVLSARTMGWRFTLRSAAAVFALGYAVTLHAHVLHLSHPNPLYSVLAGSALGGLGILAFVRHDSSLGGFNVLALLIQSRGGPLAGKTLLVIDAAVLSASFLVIDADKVLLSIVGALTMDVFLALNHKPGRYTGF